MTTFVPLKNIIQPFFFVFIVSFNTQTTTYDLLCHATTTHSHKKRRLQVNDYAFENPLILP